MGIMTIDGQAIEFTDEPNVLSVIRKAGIDIPTLCYHSELSIYGACRLCTVEDDRGKTFASCSEKPRDGMIIYTNTPRLMRYRKLILELLLAAHCRDCTTCIKSGECHLQELAHRMGVHEIRFENVREIQPIDTQGRVRHFGGRHHDCQSNPTYRARLSRCIAADAYYMRTAA